MNVAHELPLMPQLPPLEMPAPIATTGEQTTADARAPPDLVKSPVPSFADSFSTAYTSPVKEEDSDFHQRLLAPPLNHHLRKSISVDSFVNSNLNGARTTRANSTADLDSPQNRAYVHSTAPSTNQGRIWSGRSRGASVSSVQDGYESSSLLDSDVERFDPVKAPAERYRHVSLKPQEGRRPSLRGGELLLPARSQGLSATSSMSSVVTGSANSSPREAHPALRSVTSMQASTSTSRNPNLPTRSDVGRARSGSLGVHGTQYPTKRMTIDTHVDNNRAPPLVTLAVIGTSATGKSSVIRKGLANYNLSDSQISHAPDNPTIRYCRRTGRIPSESLPEVSLLTLEIDIPQEITGLPPLPPDFPPLDGVMVCYDASSSTTFQPVEELLKGYRAQNLPIIVLACKVDLERRIEPDRALELLQEYDVGLVEVTTAQDGGKGKMRQSFDWLVKAVFRARQSQANDNRNPASPEYLRNPSHPWDGSRTITPTAASSMPGANSVPFDSTPSTHSPSIPPMTPTSPTRAKSTGDLLAESERSRVRTQTEPSIPPNFTQRPRGDSRTTQESSPSPTVAVPNGVINGVTPAKPPERQKRDPPAAQWATLDELLDKLLFLSVSGDDPAFISHFLLTYRRFATPRSVLLAMQKRMRQLDSPCGDPMFACFAQMRICYLLETWIRDYPDDFAVKGTAGALNALIKSIISKTHLLHYGSEFLPFLEMLPARSDQDASWALKADVPADESDDSYSFLEEDEEADSQSRQPPNEVTNTNSPSQDVPQAHSGLRERKSSLPLSKSLMATTSNDPSPKQHLKDLVKLANDVLNYDSEELAQEITRQWVKRFMEIKPRDWLHYVFISSRKGEPDPITAFNVVSNHLGDWVLSLILCHDRPRHRARQIEKFVDLAHRLRVLNNYSALRAVVAGINASTFPGDETIELFKAKCPEQAKNLQSFDVLLQSIRAHRAYRLALRNSKGACIPAMEVHMSDLIRANEGNDDINEADPTKIHWGKFNMMGRFVDTTTQCQVQCRNSSDYDFLERPVVAELLTRRPVMNLEMQKSRIASPDDDFDDNRPSHSNQPKDIHVVRKLLFW